MIVVEYALMLKSLQLPFGDAGKIVDFDQIVIKKRKYNWTEDYK